MTAKIQLENMMNCLKLPLILLCLLLLTACQPELNSNNYDYYGSQESGTHEAVIQDIQYNVKIRKNKGISNLTGGISSGTVPQNIADNTAQNSLGSSNATLYIVRLNKSNRLVSVIQQNKLALCKGDHVYLINRDDHPQLTLMNNYYSNGKHTRTGCENKTSSPHRN